MEKAADKTILVVEDEPDVQFILQTTLEDAGFNVVTASDGHQAYKSVKEQMPDFITLDLVMPRQSGILFYKKLRKNSKWTNIPVMIVSAHTRDDLGQTDYEELMNSKEFAAPDAFMEKPVDPTELVEKVAKILKADVSEYLDEAADDKRSDIMTKLRGFDLDTLEKVRDMLDKHEDK